MLTSVLQAVHVRTRHSKRLVVEEIGRSFEDPSRSIQLEVSLFYYAKLQANKLKSRINLLLFIVIKLFLKASSVQIEYTKL